MKRLDEIFDIKNSPSLELMNCEQVEEGVCFVARTEKNNGITARINKLENLKPMPAGAITVALSGSVLSSFYQDEPFYTAFHIACLYPKQKLTKEQMIYYALLIEQNKYRYNYGRQANKTLKNILVPDITEIPNYVNKISISDYEFEQQSVLNKKIELDTENWKYFNLYDDKYFDMFTGKYHSKDSFSKGKIPLISASKINNGIMKFTDLKPAFNGNCLTIGKVEMTNFYQPIPFCTTADVTVLVPKFEMSKYCALFLKVVLDTEKYRWTYGNQIRLNDSQKIKIKLPATKNGQPDFEFMENYIKSLPYSKSI